MGYVCLLVNNRDIGEKNMGILQEMIKQACLLQETMNLIKYDSFCIHVCFAVFTV